MFQRPITTICWGHRDSRLFLACGPALYVVRVEHRVASLQLLCQQGIASALREERDVGKLNMPSLLCSYVTTAFIPTIKVQPIPSWTPPTIKYPPTLHVHPTHHGTPHPSRTPATIKAHTQIK